MINPNFTFMFNQTYGLKVSYYNGFPTKIINYDQYKKIRLLFITPHIASLLDPEAGGKEIAKNVNDFFDGKQVENLIPPGKGY